MLLIGIGDRFFGIFGISESRKDNMVAVSSFLIEKLSVYIILMLAEKL